MIQHSIRNLGPWYVDMLEQFRCHLLQHAAKRCSDYTADTFDSVISL